MKIRVQTRIQLVAAMSAFEIYIFHLLPHFFWEMDEETNSSPSRTSEMPTPHAGNTPTIKYSQNTIKQFQQVGEVIVGEPTIRQLCIVKELKVQSEKVSMHQ